MVTRLILLFIVLAMVFSCSDDSRPNEVPRLAWKTGGPALSLDSTFQSCDSVFIATFPGTACCVSGPTVAKPGAVVRYHYQINYSDPHVSWQILEGDISIIAGQDTPTVTVLFGANFTTGIVFGDGNGIPQNITSRQRCTDRVIVKNN
jgi:hypothetical protein